MMMSQFMYYFKLCWLTKNAQKKRGEEKKSRDSTQQSRQQPATEREFILSAALLCVSVYVHHIVILYIPYTISTIVYIQYWYMYTVCHFGKYSYSAFAI